MQVYVIFMYHQKKHTTYVPKSELDILPSDHFEIINTKLLCKLAFVIGDLTKCRPIFWE